MKGSDLESIHASGKTRGDTRSAAFTPKSQNKSKATRVTRYPELLSLYASAYDIAPR
jgi:hypothetical protein